MGIMPGGSTPLQHMLAEMTAEEIAAIDCREIIRAHDAAACDEKWLPWLAWENSIGDAEGWMFAETEGAKRRLIRSAYELHIHKGTPYSIKQFFRAAGFGEIKLHEGGSGKKRNGTVRYRDGFHLRGSSRRWAHYQIEFLTEPIRKNQTDTVARGIGSYAPARSILTGLKQKRGVLLHNGKALRNGQYFRGKANIWQI